MFVDQGRRVLPGCCQCRKNEQIFHIETADGEDASSIIHLFSKTNQHFSVIQNIGIDSTHSSDLLTRLGDEALGEALRNLLELSLEFLAKRTFPVDLVEHV